MSDTATKRPPEEHGTPQGTSSSQLSFRSLVTCMHQLNFFHQHMDHKCCSVNQESKDNNGWTIRKEIRVGNPLSAFKFSMQEFVFVQSHA